MQYLRMLTNALIGGALVGAYVTLLVLQLNPAVSLVSVSTLRLILTWWIFYGVHATAFFYLLIVLRQLFAAEMRSPGWLSLRLLAQLGTLAMSMAAIVTWMNLRGFRAVLGPAAAERMTNGAVALSACAGLCVVLMLIQIPIERGRRAVALLFVAVVIASLAVPIRFRGFGEAAGAARVQGPLTITAVPSPGRVLMVLIDGASLDYIAPAAAGGRVPNFGRIIERGAVMHLATLRPTQPAPVWTAVATGKLPYKTTIYSAARYHVTGSSVRLDLLPDFCFAQSLFRFGLLTEQMPTADAVQSHSMWELLGGFGITSGVIDWPVTYPARAANGYLVSDEFMRRDDSAVLASMHDEAPLVWPPEALDRVRAARAAVSVDPQHATDAIAEHIAQTMSADDRVQFSAVRYSGLDAVGHYYLRYAMPRAFGDVSPEERARFGHVLDEYYTYVDAIVGRAINSLGPDDLLLVVSGFGMQPLGIGKRLLERLAGDAQLSGTHEGAPDGFVMAYGKGVVRGALPRTSVLDLAPTVLYFFGLPIPRDMDGFARTDIFTPAFTDRRPITFIPSYER